MISYILATFIAFAGSLLGYALSLICPEELKAGKRYFGTLYSIFFALSLFTAVSGYSFVVSLIFGAVALFGALLLRRSIRSLRFLFFLQGIFLYLSHVSDTALFRTASLILVSGFALVSMEGAVFVEDDKIRQKIRLLAVTLKYYPWIFASALLPFLISNLK